MTVDHSYLLYSITYTLTLEALTNVLHKNILRTLEGKGKNYYIRKLF